jgi:uncharacterized protein
MDLAISDKERIIEICRKNDIAFCALFGSYARQQANDKSDVDLLIRFSKPKSLLGHISISHQLQDALGKEIDLVTESELSPHIRENVLRDLKVIYGE